MRPPPAAGPMARQLMLANGGPGVGDGDADAEGLGLAGSGDAGEGLAGAVSAAARTNVEPTIAIQIETTKRKLRFTKASRN
jgi:hypothetical protein